MFTGILLLLLVPACTRERTTPDEITLPAAQVTAAVAEGSEPAVQSEGQPNTATDGNSSDGDSNAPTATSATESGTNNAQAEPVIVVPTPVPVESSSGTTSQTTNYTVTSGDTLFLIADKFGVSADDIRRMNYLQGDNIQAGQILRVPLLEGYTELGRPTPTPEPLIHVVTAGETLYGIARQYSVAPTTIIQANNIANQDGIFVGQGLRIPGYAASPSSDTIPDTSGNDAVSGADGNGSPAQTNIAQTEHIVQPGEGLYAIAAEYGVSAVEIATANNIQNYELLRVGQRLFIPGVLPRTTQSQGTGQRIHVVQAGEGLLQIAVNYGISAQAIADVNNIADSDLIYPGQQLVIPGQ